VRITLKVHPNSKNPRVEIRAGGELHIYVKEPAIENKANEAVIEKLSEYYRVPKSKIALKRGEKSKLKLFEIEK
jgi:uncharacterized protein YggU (UPF0235/DUF167 family)